MVSASVSWIRSSATQSSPCSKSTPPSPCTGSSRPIASSYRLITWALFWMNMLANCFREHFHWKALLGLPRTMTPAYGGAFFICSPSEDGRKHRTMTASLTKKTVDLSEHYASCVPPLARRRSGPTSWLNALSPCAPRAHRKSTSGHSSG